MIKAWIFLAEVEMYFEGIYPPWTHARKRWLVRAETKRQATAILHAAIEADKEIRLVVMESADDPIDLNAEIIDVS